LSRTVGALVIAMIEAALGGALVQQTRRSLSPPVRHLTA
jgi:hypothetical protein